MQFSTLTDEEKKQYCELLFAPLSSSSELKDWVRGFLGLELPLEITDPDSTSSPLDAVWQIYNAFKSNSGDVNPGYILLSCREGMKTVSVAILETLLMLHFQIEIAHAAAIESQSSVGLGYISEFISKIKPLMEYAGWVPDTANKRTIKFKTPQGKITYIKVLICTVKGMNSLHVNALFLDELDLADPKALKQARNIVGYSKGIYGITVYLSTRKYAFGNMNEAIDSAEEKNYKIIKWNILDVTESCPPSRHKPEEPKEDRYIAQNLPLIQIPKEEFDLLPDPEKHKWFLVKEAYSGCKTCKLLPVCRKKLADKPETATGGFYKPIVSVIQKFADNDPDTAESELMCWRPGSQGLIYPRFNSQVGNGNVIDYKMAYETLIGEKINSNHVSETILLQKMSELNIQFYAGVDWGYVHDFVIIIVAMIPNGEVWVMETFASPGLEFADQLEIAKSFRDKYNVQTWYCDTAMPSHLKSFTKNGMKSPNFTKDILGGIEAVRSKITDATGKRLFKILTHHTNKKLITAITKHRFLLDGQGNPTMKPDDDRGIADLCFVPGTLIYTKYGPKPIEEIQTGDEVLTHLGRFRKVLNTMSRDYDGEVVTVRAYCKTPVTSTPNHEFLLTESVRSFDTINGVKLTGQRIVKDVFMFSPIGEVRVPLGRDRKLKPIPSIHFPIIDFEELNTIDLKEYYPSRKDIGGYLLNKSHNGKIKRFIDLNEEFCFLIGYFVAEGSLSGNGSGIFLAGHQKETNVKLLIDKVCEDTGINKSIWRPSNKDKSRGIIISSSPLHSFFKQCKSKINKKFPDLIHSLNRKQTISVLAGYIFGDGHISKNGLGIKSNSISKDLSYAVYIMFTKLGYRPSFKYSKRKGRYKGFGKNGIIQNDTYNVILSSEDSISFLKEARSNSFVDLAFLDKINKTIPPKQSSYTQQVVGKALISNIDWIKRENYKGKVYNIEVEEDNSYIANLYSVHNCDALRYIGQNKFPVKGTQKPNAVWTEAEQYGQPQNPTATEQMKNEIFSRVSDGGGSFVGGTGKKGGFHYSF